MTNVEIEVATQDHTLWVISQIDRHRHEFGFWPTQAIYQAVEERRTYLIRQNGQLASFLIRSPAQYQVKLYATFTDAQARLQDYCRALVVHFAKEAAESHAERLTLRTAEDLPANLVWHRLGLTRGRTDRPKNKTSRAMINWELKFPRGEELDAWLDEQTADPTRKRLLQAFGMEEQFRGALTSRYRRNKR